MRRTNRDLFPPPVNVAGDVPYLAARRAERAWQRILAAGIVIAVLFHLAIALLFHTTLLMPSSPFGAAGPAMGDVSAAAGGDGGLTMVEVRVVEEREEPEEEQEVVTPVPTPDVVIEPEEVEPVREADPAASTSLPGRTADEGSGGESGEDEGPGTATGEGEGSGGTGETGASDVVPPTPRGVILPPSDRPASARGSEITVWVFVTARGTVLPDSTRLDPPTSDRRYNQRLMRSAAEWVFEPARRAGRAVSSWYPFQIIL